METVAYFFFGKFFSKILDKIFYNDEQERQQRQLNAIRRELYEIRFNNRPDKDELINMEHSFVEIDKPTN